METTGITFADVAGAGVLGLFFHALAAAGISLLLQKSMQYGMPLRRYYLLLCLIWIRSRRTKTARRWRQILKPLGLCLPCMNIWVAVATFSLGCFEHVQIPLFFGMQFLIFHLATK